VNHALPLRCAVIDDALGERPADTGQTCEMPPVGRIRVKATLDRWFGALWRARLNALPTVYGNECYYATARKKEQQRPLKVSNHGDKDAMLSDMGASDQVGDRRKRRRPNRTPF
jgi:hypothetical protein